MPPPSIPTAHEQAILTRERLRLLSWAYYISGGIGIVTISFFLFHVIFFVVLAFLPETDFPPPAVHSPATSSPSSHPHPSLSPTIIFRILAGIMGSIVLCGWLLSGLTIYAGRCLQKCRHRPFIYVMGCLNLIWIPYGTILGICTLLALSSESARLAFSSPPPLPANANKINSR